MGVGGGHAQDKAEQFGFRGLKLLTLAMGNLQEVCRCDLSG